ncbi:hypothetical protein SAMN05880501_10885 [Ureibacillus xyleni]|uniref:Copper amine oxidase-like protein n=1 Tax=Ureibacillus xyleni TaxID=614648 RepID=A0A285T738_9BACL|nr:hypothetical protein [Ureibacillus xyleni]SOC15401.1 hypothetical protein SAMN05880501_10885 [Ureibacillus xyleni]
MKRLLLLIPVLIIALMVPSMTTASANTNYHMWNGTTKEIDLSKDVRTITFSQAINESQLLKNGAQLIQLFDITNPENKQQLLTSLSIDQKDARKVHVHLQKGYAYKAGHTYSLVIEKDVSSAKSKPLEQGVQFNFKMNDKAPVPITFGKSYKVTNLDTSTKRNYVNVSKGAFYVGYNQYGNMEWDDVDTYYTYIPMFGNTTAIISYLPGVDSEILEQENFMVEPTTDVAFYGMKINEGDSIEITNNHDEQSLKVFFGNKEASSRVSYVNYLQDGTIFHSETDRQIERYDYTSAVQAKGKVIIKNLGKNPLYVFSQKTKWDYTEMKMVNED